MGELQFSGTINKYLTQESQSSDTARIIDCKGYYSASCDPLAEMRWVQRTTWAMDDFTLSLQWRHIDGIDAEPVVADDYFPEFRSIDSYDYFDLYANYHLTDNITASLGIDNLFEKDPPVVGNEAGDTSSNSGNTFPSNYDVLGRKFKLGLRFQF